MKQMSLIEMDGFLKGKCIPRDLKVNETNAEYLVRKFAELEAKCGTSWAGCAKEARKDGWRISKDKTRAFAPGHKILRSNKGE